MVGAKDPEIFKPGQFENVKHFYTKVLNAEVHPLVRHFLRLSKEMIINRYYHLNPRVDKKLLNDFLSYETNHLRWAGADLFQTTTATGFKQTIVIETNSCPSGQKSMPWVDEYQDNSGYRLVLENSFQSVLKDKELIPGVLAVIYDKNHMEASGYAATMADVFNETVYLVPFFQSSWQENARYTKDRVLEVRVEGKWLPVRAAMRYVTQKPWNRIPVNTRTHILNPVIGCLAGGRNKLVAAKAYEVFNAGFGNSGLKINIPPTVYDVARMEIPFVIKSLGGRGVIKVPYSNAGQGVYTITNQGELDAFMDLDHPYDKFIVQGLVGNSEWATSHAENQLFHVGTIPNKKNEIYVADLRFMVTSGIGGFRPVGCYARRARKPLSNELHGSEDSWEMLGTNLSVKLGQDQWTSEINRLLLMDRKDFNQLGIGIDQLIESYIQTVLATIAIDQMADSLIGENGNLNKNLFKSLNKDKSLMSEIYAEYE